MSFNLSNSVDLIANSVKLIKGNQLEDITTLFLSKDEAVSGIVGLPPATLNTLEKISSALDNDPNFFTSNEGRLQSKANTVDVANQLNLKANVLTTYSKTETNNITNLKADQATVNVQFGSLVAVLTTETDEKLALKANAATTYSKGQVDTKFTDIINSAPLALDTLSELASALNNDSNYASNIQNQIILKAAKTDVFTKAEVNTALDAKASVDGVFATLNNYDSRFVTSGKLDLKSDKATSYTQTEINTKLDLKPDKTLVFTKAEVTTALDLKASTDGVFATLNNYDSRFVADGKFLLKSDKATSFTQTEINEKLLLKQDSLLTGVFTNALPIISGKNTIRALAVTAPLTIVNNGSSHLTLGIDQSAINQSLSWLSNTEGYNFIDAAEGGLVMRAGGDSAVQVLGSSNVSATEGPGDVLFYKNAKILGGLTVAGNVNLSLPGKADLTYVNTELNKKEPVYEVFSPLKKVLNIATAKIEMRLDTDLLNPYWIAANVNISGSIYAQKGLNNITVISKNQNDTAYTLTFPEHPDGNRYMVLFGSTEFHCSYRNQTSTSLIVYTRASNNGQGTEGGGTFSVVILR
jgi:hypothetical protein